MAAAAPGVGLEARREAVSPEPGLGRSCLAGAGATEGTGDTAQSTRPAWLTPATGCPGVCCFSPNLSPERSRIWGNPLPGFVSGAGRLQPHRERGSLSLITLFDEAGGPPTGTPFFPRKRRRLRRGGPGLWEPARRAGDPRDGPPGQGGRRGGASCAAEGACVCHLASTSASGWGGVTTVCTRRDRKAPGGGETWSVRAVSLTPRVGEKHTIPGGVPHAPSACAKRWACPAPAHGCPLTLSFVPSFRLLLRIPRGPSALGGGRS